MSWIAWKVSQIKHYLNQDSLKALSLPEAAIKAPNKRKEDMKVIIRSRSLKHNQFALKWCCNASLS